MRRFDIFESDLDRDYCDDGDFVSAEEALREIEKLRTENEALRAKLRWIPVTERLPAEQGDYLCFLASGERITLRFKPETDPRLGPMARSWQGNYGCYHNVTHWMPLPDAPDQGPQA